jgi:hypothetical protein
MSAQVWLNANLVRLQHAVLCANCEIISEGLNGHCACCGSVSLLRLNGVLGGSIEARVSSPRIRTADVGRNDIYPLAAAA